MNCCGRSTTHSHDNREKLMTEDWHAMTVEVMDLLRKEGLTTEADRLKQAFENSFSGTEIAMGIRWYLEEDKVAKKLRDPDASAKARNLEELLNRLLA
jgi:hypothetical protein